jgi:hypothetical protein
MNILFFSTHYAGRFLVLRVRIVWWIIISGHALDRMSVLKVFIFLYAY